MGYLRNISLETLRYLKGYLSAFVVYPYAERYEKRNIRSKYQELKSFYGIPFKERKKLAASRLADIVEFAGRTVPYYCDLFKLKQINSSKIRKDIKYLQDIPFLTKDTIREQKHRLLSMPLNDVRHHLCKTGGSTGLPCQIIYDQEAADYSSAVTLYARDRIGKKKYLSEIHFASRFPEVFPLKDRIREHFKCFSMNRRNVFFDRLDDEALERIWRKLLLHSANLVHAHPSTIYALSCYIERTKGTANAFKIFESSGELLESYMRKKIENVLQCRVVDRYGLAEFGIIGYQFSKDSNNLVVLESEGWPEAISTKTADKNSKEIVFTGFRNKLMPLIRYKTGDLAQLDETENGFIWSNMMGRIHDFLRINDGVYPTHYIQDVLDRVGGIQEFQIDMRINPPKLIIVPELEVDPEHIRSRLNSWWKDGISIEFGTHNDMVRVGIRDKFRHVVTG